MKFKFQEGDVVQVLYSKDSKGNACISFAEVKEVLASEESLIINRVINLKGKTTVPASSIATSLRNGLKIPFSRALIVNKDDILYENALLKRYQ